MKGSPIKQNLSTSFVDLSLLVRYLRDRNFTGSIRLEWAEEYEAEIFFTQSRRLQAREYDRRIGRIAQGQAAFQRILQRSRQPRGVIRVLRNDPDQTAAYLRKAFVDERIISGARQSAFGMSDQLATISDREPLPLLPAIDSARAALLATDLLLAFKEGFERTRISFYPAFAIACGVKCDEYPFLDPDGDQFSFYRDEIFISEKVDSDELFEGIVSALRHILIRLTGDGRFTNAVVYLRHRIQQHLSTRHKDYETLGLVSVADRLLA